ncbi:hypothetical protein TKK_0007134 [Trichogramma kaykai]|uniref:BZIP domain-containing protein n=1 Tax=Trichogramma kaykai TaxID=54128 RepID=A0ABD2XAD2_9HYME
MESPSTSGIADANFTDVFSTLHLLRNYNGFLSSQSDNQMYGTRPHSDLNPSESKMVASRAMLSRGDMTLSPLSSSTSFTLSGLFQPPLLSSVQPLIPTVALCPSFSNANAAAAFIENAVISSIQQPKRHRSEKTPIPDEQKDEKYYERRKRNNEAAKKSRDARRIREDQIALRATMLEHENAILRAQLVAMREECQLLRQMLIKQRMPPLVQSTCDYQLNVRENPPTISLLTPSTPTSSSVKG